MNSRFLAAVAIALAVSACSAKTLDRPIMSRFEPTDDGFSYVSSANATYPENDAAAEQTRMDWLQEYLSLNAVCPNGYDITARKPVLIKKALLGDVYSIHYTGRCR